MKPRKRPSSQLLWDLLAPLEPLVLRMELVELALGSPEAMSNAVGILDLLQLVAALRNTTKAERGRAIFHRLRAVTRNIVNMNTYPALATSHGNFQKDVSPLQITRTHSSNKPFQKINIQKPMASGEIPRGVPKETGLLKT